MLATRNVSSTSSRSARRQAGDRVEAGLALLAGDLDVEHAEERLQRRPRAGPACTATSRACRASGPGTGWRRARRARSRTPSRRRRSPCAVNSSSPRRNCASLAVARRRVVLDQAVERLQRRLEVAALLVGARHLVEDAVVVRVGRVGLQVLLVARDRRLVVGRARGRGARALARLSALSISRSPRRRIASERCGAAGAMSRNLR